MRITTPVNKISYTIPCASRFRDAITDLAKRRHCNVADLARSVVLLAPGELIEAHPDPGGPARDDRETVVLKSGKSKGKPWQRKPRLQVRLGPGYAIETIRKALGLALAMDRGHLELDVRSLDDRVESEMKQEAQHALLRESHDELERLRTMVASLTFAPLPDGVRSREQALYVLGFPPGTAPSQDAIRMRFRKLATVYHPDGKHGSHQHMSQINSAMELLRRGWF